MQSYSLVIHMEKKAMEEGMLEFATRSRRLIPLAVGAVGLLLIVGGLVFEYINQHQTDTSEVTSENPMASVAGVNTLVKIKLIKVDVSGSVMKPGVVEIPYDSRIQDVLITAGGLSPKADRTYVSRNINLAQRVVDGSKIYIPAVGETVNAGSGISTDLQQISADPNNGALININSASESQLDSLPGVGPVTAAKIIVGRPYQDISELTVKKVVGASVFEKIRDKITVN